MTFRKKIWVTKITFGYIKKNKLMKGEETYFKKVPLERVRAEIKKKYNSILIEPKVNFYEATYEFNLKDGKEVKS